MINYKEFVNYYAETNGITKKQAVIEIKRFSNTFKSATAENEGVNLVGFMKSEIVNMPAKTIRNPKTQENIDVPAKKVVKVKISKNFRDMRNEA